jgi:hypothetical protein
MDRGSVGLDVQQMDDDERDIRTPLLTRSNGSLAAISAHHLKVSSRSVNYSHNEKNELSFNK